MQIGKAGPPTTKICVATADAVEIRGRNLCRDLMGRMSFTDYFFLLLTGREASEQQRYFLDLLLVAIAEHGMMPTVQAARMSDIAQALGLTTATVSCDPAWEDRPGRVEAAA